MNYVSTVPLRSLILYASQKNWLCDEIALLECSIQGYHCIRHDSHCRGGGVAMFISDTLESQALLSGNNGLQFHLVSVYDAK